MRLQISEVQLGIAIFCFALGTFTVLFLAHKIIDQFGVGKCSFWGLIAHSIAFIFPFIAPSYPALCISLFLVGLTGGFTDISINTLVSELEKRDKVYIMSSAHGFFSLGGIVGGGIGSVMIGIINNSVVHIIIVACMLIIINALFAKNYLSIENTKSVSSSKFSLSLFRPLLIIGIIGFVVMGGEGAIVDWSALYLEQICDAKDGLVGLGYTLFSIFMTIGRFLGDGISGKYGSTKIMIGGSLIAISSYGLILSGNLPISLAGFALIGVGFSVIVPELFRMGGNVEGVSSSQGISFIAGIGYVGFLTGPVIMGGVAGLAGLKASFIVLLIFAIISFLLSLLLERKQ